MVEHNSIVLGTGDSPKACGLASLVYTRKNHKSLSQTRWKAKTDTQHGCLLIPIHMWHMNACTCMHAYTHITQRFKRKRSKSLMAGRTHLQYPILSLLEQEIRQRLTQWLAPSRAQELLVGPLDKGSALLQHRGPNTPLKGQATSGNKRMHPHVTGAAKLHLSPKCHVAWAALACQP